MNKIKLFFVAGVALLIASCSNDSQTKQQVVVNKDTIRNSYILQIKKWEKEMHKTMELDNVTAGLAIKSYNDFVKTFPDDSLCADFLFKAGEIATALKQYPQSLMYYKKITDKYPDYKNFVASLYLQGFLLDNYLNDDAKAKVIYEEVITKYPTSMYADNAKMAINNLGKSDEELIKEFKKKNHQK
jgi:outer membrane protein assembly factor BamD (BamD/ComL family)